MRGRPASTFSIPGTVCSIDCDRRKNTGAEVVVADRPGAALIELLDGVDATILIDAVRSGSPPGTLHDLDLRTLLRSAVRPVSSHDLGVAVAIQLADALGRLPARGRLLGIETPGTRSADGSAPVEDAIPEVVSRARAWVIRFRSLSP
jgi:hydrogenase maturation protease